MKQQYEFSQDTSINNFDIEDNSSESAEKLKKPVYYIESPDDSSVLVGIDVSIRKINNNETSENNYEISWFDTTRDRIMYASDTQAKGDFFAFKRSENEGGGYYYFAPMSVELYNENVKSKLIDGKSFENNDDLIKAFLETKNSN